jgi:hypothetical protein
MKVCRFHEIGRKSIFILNASMKKRKIAPLKKEKGGRGRLRN